MSADLTQEALRAILAPRPFRTYAAVVSTGAAARGWAGEGAPDGAVLIAERQIAPRGHAGRPLASVAATGLAFALVLRPSLPLAREGWLYATTLAALSDLLGDEARIAWPDEVRCDRGTLAAVAVHTRVDRSDLSWAVVEVLLPHAEPPRGELLGEALAAIESRIAAPAARVLGDYTSASETIGRRVRATLRAGTGARVEGEAVGLLEDGALVLATTAGVEVPVRPQDVRRLDPVR